MTPDEILAEYRPTLAELDDARAELARYTSAYAAGWLARAVRTIASGGPLLRADVAVALVVLESSR